MKADKMIQPEKGPQFRDIIAVTLIDRYYAEVTMSCGHKKKLTRHHCKLYRDDATLCLECKK